jgi:DHA1 family tetracycline resistance protein-like MFS transporter
MNNIFAYFTSSKAPFQFPGMHFLLGAFCMLLAVIIANRVLSREKKEHASAKVPGVE